MSTWQPSTPSGDLWPELAHVAVETDRIEARATRKVGVWVIALVVLAAAVFFAGLWTPRVTTFASASEGNATAGRASIDFEVRNEGLVPVHLAGPAAANLPGLEAVGVDAVTVPALGTTTVRVHLHITNCDAVRAWVQRSNPVDNPATLQVDTWRGKQPIQLLGIDSHAAAWCQVDR